MLNKLVSLCNKFIILNHVLCSLMNVFTFALHSQELTVTDDTVLEEHSEDPSLVQMRLLGDGGNYKTKAFR